MKKKKGLLLGFMLLLASAAQAYDFSAVAPSGQTLYYNIVDNNAKVTYPGTNAGSYAWMDYTKPSGALTIPNTVVYNGTTYSVTAIGIFAFYDCTGLTSVTIPNSVTNISHYIFYNCTDLTSVTIGNSVTSIYDNAFNGCSALTTVIIPNTVTSIGSGAFDGCSALTSVTIPVSIDK